MHKGSYPRGFYGKDATWLRTKVAELEDENGISDDSTTLEPSSDRRTGFYDTVKEPILTSTKESSTHREHEHVNTINIAEQQCDEVFEHSWLFSIKQGTKVAAHDGSCRLRGIAVRRVVKREVLAYPSHYLYLHRQ